jgi:hypothetical protein
VSVFVDCHELSDKNQSPKISTNALIFPKRLPTTKYVMVALRYIVTCIVALVLVLLLVALES